MPEISARLSVPNRVITPATTQTRSSSSGDSSWEAIKPGFLKMPEPMTEPMAKATAAIRPISRSNSTGFFVSLPFMVVLFFVWNCKCPEIESDHYRNLPKKKQA